MMLLEKGEFSSSSKADMEELGEDFKQIWTSPHIGGVRGGLQATGRSVKFVLEKD